MAGPVRAALGEPINNQQSAIGNQQSAIGNLQSPISILLPARALLCVADSHPQAVLEALHR
jgi:hypothetical protein